MVADVKASRPYNSRNRSDQAQRTRRAIIDAAHTLFLREGFSATTVQAIAAAAGTAVPTVYKVFGTKTALAKAVFDVAIAGDDEQAPLVERGLLSRVRAEADPEHKLVLYGRFLAKVAPRHVPVQLVIRDAAKTDPEAATIWEQLQDERLRGMTHFAKDLHAQAMLRPDVSAREARDVLWTYNSAEIYELLVITRGWTPRRYGTWITAQLITALLKR